MDYLQKIYCLFRLFQSTFTFIKKILIPVDHWTNIWALGCALLLMLALNNNHQTPNFVSFNWWIEIHLAEGRKLMNADRELPAAPPWCYFVTPWPGLRTPCACGGGTRATLAVVQILGGGPLRTAKALDHLQRPCAPGLVSTPHSKGHTKNKACTATTNVTRTCRYKLYRRDSDVEGCYLGCYLGMTTS